MKHKRPKILHLMCNYKKKNKKTASLNVLLNVSVTKLHGNTGASDTEDDVTQYERHVLCELPQANCKGE